MDCKEFTVDMREYTPEQIRAEQEVRNIVYRMNRTDETTDEYRALLKDLFGDNIGEGSFVASGLHGAAIRNMKIGNNVYINSNALLMARGGITIEDNVLIAADASLISNNHDPYDRMILTCRPVLICEGAWIGARAMILPGVRVGKRAIVGGGAIVTKDVPDYAVAVGCPAKVVKMLDPEKFPDARKGEI